MEEEVVEEGRRKEGKQKIKKKEMDKYSGVRGITA